MFALGVGYKQFVKNSLYNIYKSTTAQFAVGYIVLEVRLYVRSKCLR